MANALWITLIGMGLVFAAILLLWALMALLVRVTTEPEPVQQELDSLHSQGTGPAEAPETGHEGARTPAVSGAAAAAAAAVAIAMASKKAAQTGFSASQVAKPAAEPGSISAWQAVHRAVQINQHERISRKKVLR